LLGVYSTIKLLGSFLKKERIKEITYISTFLIALLYVIVIHTLIGYAKFLNPISLIINIQYLTGFFGIVIALYLFNYRKIKIEKIFYDISIIFFVAIILNLFYSIFKVGI